MLLTVYIFITQLLLCLCVYARMSLIIRFIFVNPEKYLDILFLQGAIQL